MKVSFWAAMFLIVIGIIILLVPDSGEVMLQFNADHGPSWQDFIGVSIIVITWGWLMAKTIQRRRAVGSAIGRKGIIGSVFAVILGALLIVGGLMARFDKALFLGIVLSGGGYGFLIIPAFRVRADIEN